MLALHGAGIALVEPHLLAALQFPTLTSRPLVPHIAVRSLLVLNRSAPRSRIVYEFVQTIRTLAGQ